MDNLINALINQHDWLVNDTNEDYYYNYTGEYPSFDADTSPCTAIIGGNWINMALAVVYGLVCFLAVTGNTIVMVVILFNRCAIIFTDIYLLHLAVSDLLFAITLPFWAVDAISGWVFGDAMCKIISLLQEVNFYSGILLLACISVDCCVSIVYSKQMCGWKKLFLTKLACIAVWFMAILLSLPNIYKVTYIPPRSSITICTEVFSGKSAETWATITNFWWKLIGIIIPLAIMIFCCSLMIWKLCQTKRFWKQKAMKVITAVVLAFFICWLPYNITVLIDMLMRNKLIDETCDRQNRIDKALFATQALGFLHCCINPILYAFIRVNFRRNVINLLATKGIAKQSKESNLRRSDISSSDPGFT